MAPVQNFQLPLEVLPDFMKSVEVLKISQIAAVMLTVYDHMITLDWEVEYIWKRRWSISKTLFILVRYAGELVLVLQAIFFVSGGPSVQVSQMGFYFTPLGTTFCICICQIILIMRLYALYGQSKRLLMLLTALFLMEFAGMMYWNILSYVNVELTLEPFPGVHICIPSGVPKLFPLYWAYAIAFETIVFSLIMRIIYRDFAEARAIARLRTVSLMNVLMRDNFVYFFIALTADLITGISWAATPGHPAISACWVEATSIIVGGRLILNLCRAFYSDSSASLRYATEWEMR
ncbi:hypothetical protein BDQ12DRAFT_162314 [Crucibulum laeve]|uniref:DUF6533 domain-containing protein n=1 Tax=Crucibulum laeve TaxID=68775 RepID=A0A5C3LEK9_9AGAR|nr:hypothetical protein BDQ12DRAFT_162314 [Crucibulum laeve]